MAIFGLLLVFLGAGLGLVTFLGLGYDSDGDRDRQVAILGNNTTPETVFALGIIIGAVLLLGLWFMKTGAQRGLARRRELKRVDELSAELDAERRKNRATGTPTDTRTDTPPPPPPDDHR